MSRKKSPVVSPQPATSVLRRSARLVSLRSEGKPTKDLSFGSEPPPRRIRRELGPEANKSPGSLRRSLRVSKRGVSDAGKEKSPPFSSAKPASTPSSGSYTLRRSPRFSSEGGNSMYHLRSGNSVLSSCSSTKSSGGDGVRSRDSSRSRPRSKTKQILRDSEEEEEDVSVRLSEGKENGVRSKDISRSRPCPNTKQICIDCDCYDEDEEEEVSPCLNEVKRRKLAKENEPPKADEGTRIDKEEGFKTKNERGWTDELELALQGAYLTVKPSPNFWKKVSKMVPGKSAQECFDRVNADLITPRQTQPRSRARKSNLSPIPQFSLSASKPLKPISPTKTKIRQRKGNLSKKAIRHLVEKQNHMDQGLGFDLFSVLEPGSTSSFLSTPTEKGKSLPRIIESPMPGSSKDQANLVSPPVLKQVKNKALHEKYIDHLHVREAKRKAEYRRLVGKENVRPMDNQTNVRAAKDALFFDVQDAMQKLKGLETEDSSSSEEFCYGLGETDEEDESI